VDDGSTDATLDIARQYESSTLKVIQQENQGACSARNRAFEECQGDYIQWLDADDLLAAHKIERQMIEAEGTADHNILFTSAWGRFYYRPHKAKFQTTGLWRGMDAVDWLVLRMANPWMMHPSTWLVSRRLTEKAGPWDERLTRNQDGEYFCRIVSRSHYVKFVKKSRCYYRMVNPQSVSHSNSRKDWESLYLSIGLTVDHVLAREDSERTRPACISRLNMVASQLDPNAPDLAHRLRERIIEMGGKITPESTSQKYAIVKSMAGEKNARFLKEKIWRAQRRISREYDWWLAKLFGNKI
jgi:glycosyltransferase involved in cell wall biosynthesis